MDWFSVILLLCESLNGIIVCFYWVMVEMFLVDYYLFGESF